MDSAIVVALISGVVSLLTVVFSSIMGIIGTRRTKERQAEIEQRQAEIEKFKEWDTLRQNVAAGTQCLLRAEIIRSHEKYIDRGYCPVYAKESLTKEYQAYHNLGGNDVATALYEQLMALPSERRYENE